MNALMHWPNSRCSVVGETRSISGLSPYNNRKTAESGASCEPRLQFIRHQARGCSQAGRALTFISFRREEASHATVAFVPALCPVLESFFSIVLFFGLSGSQFYSILFLSKVLA